MARLDAFFATLFKPPAGAGAQLLFESGQQGRLLTNAGEAVLIKEPLTSAQIASAVGEVVPVEHRPAFPAEGTTSFAYESPSGRVNIWVVKQGDHVKVTVVPDAAAAVNTPAPTPAPVPTGRAAAVAPPSAAVAFGGKPPADASQAMHQLLDLMLDRKASDLHLTSGSGPLLRVDGDIKAVEGYGVIDAARMRDLVFSITPTKNRDDWERGKDTDFGYETSRARFRVNVFEDRMGIGAVLRQIPRDIISAEKMGLSKEVLDLCFLTKGLVLVTGPTGSGKSTTLAGMVDFVNRNRDDHIITIEDPIEFVHENKRCLVNQREIGLNTAGFKNALRAALREDPDVVLVGELRDLETMAIAIETAETGHVVFGTLHTNTAPSTIDRIIDQFPPDRQNQIRMMLSESLKGVISQVLCKKIGGGRVAAREVLICTSGVANLIREAKTFQIPSLMQTGRAIGMVTMNDALLDLVKKRVVEPREAYFKAPNKSDFRALLARAGFQVEAADE
jgi:twitching motility protein PilT